MGCLGIGIVFGFVSVVGFVRFKGCLFVGCCGCF